MRVEAVFVGTELLEHRVNTHVRDVSDRLAGAGLRLERTTVVSDEVGEIDSALREALSRADTVIAIGGLGPTFDDLTREGAARALGRRLVFAPRLLDGIRRKFRAKGYPMAPENRRQAFVIDGARSIPNPRGSAPGQVLSLRRGKRLFLLPGPFHEMAPMLEAAVLPALRRAARSRPLARLELHLAGLIESEADRRLRPIVRSHSDVRCTILSGKGLVSIYANGESRRAVERFAAAARRALGHHAFAEGRTPLAASVGRRLASLGQTLSAAESCTGGLLAARLTDVPGSSRYFLGGLVAYSNELKRSELGVPPEVLKRRGAVSGPCAETMADGCRLRYGSDWGVAVTGVAGPGGGTKTKPVGEVWISVSGPGASETRRFRFSGDRQEIRDRAVHAALFRLWRLLGAGAPEGRAKPRKGRPLGLAR